MEENKSGLLYKCATALLVSIILTIGGCVTKTNMLVTEMVTAGADPLVASCAIAVQGDHSLCLMVAAKQPLAK